MTEREDAARPSRNGRAVTLLLRGVAILLIVVAVLTSQAHEATDSPEDQLFIDDSLVLARQMPDAAATAELMGGPMVQVQSGEPVGLVFESMANQVLDFRRNVVESAWQDAWFAPDGIAQYQASAVTFRYRDYRARDLVRCDPVEPWGDIPGATTAGLLAAAGPQAAACARLDNGRVTVWVHLVVNGPGARAQLPALLTRAIDDMRVRVPDSPDAPVDMDMNRTRAAILWQWVLFVLILPIGIFLVGWLRDRATWQALVRALFAWSPNPRHLSVGLDAAAARRWAATGSLLRWAALAWAVRLTEVWGLTSFLSLLLLGGVFAGTTWLESWLWRRKTERTVRPLVPVSGRLAQVTAALVGAAVAALGVLMWAGGVEQFAMGTRGLGEPEWRVRITALTAQVFGLLVFSLAGFVIVYGRRVMMRTVATQPPEQGPFILYLRNFSDDYLTMRSTGRGRLGLLDRVFMRRRESFEEIVTHLLGQSGQVLAVGRPGELLPSGLGARRLYFGDDWQERVGELINDADTVVLSLGRSQGLVWEMERLFDFGVLHKTVFVMPPVDAAEQSRRLALVADLFSIPYGHLEPMGHHVLALCFPLGSSAPVVISAPVQDEFSYDLAVAQCVEYMRRPESAPVIPPTAPMPAVTSPEVDVLPQQPLKRPKKFTWWKLAVVNGVLASLLAVLSTGAGEGDAATALLPPGTVVTHTLGGTPERAWYVLNGTDVVSADFSSGALTPAFSVEGFARHALRHDNMLITQTFRTDAEPVMLSAHDLASGTKLWQRQVDVEAPVITIAQGTVLVPDPATNRLMAFEVATGNPLSVVDLPCRPWGASVVAERVFVTCPSEERLLEIDHAGSAATVMEHTVYPGTLWVVGFDTPLAVSTRLRLITPVDAELSEPVIQLSRPAPFLDQGADRLAISGIHRISVLDADGDLTRYNTVPEPGLVSVLDDGSLAFVGDGALWHRQA